MQGNSDYNNKEFIDQSWGEMKALLDKQLPVTPTPVEQAESSRRSDRLGLIWLLSLLLLVSTSSAILFAYKYKTVPKISEVIKEKIIFKEVVKEVFVPILNRNSENISVTDARSTSRNEAAQNPGSDLSVPVNAINNGQEISRSDERDVFSSEEITANLKVEFPEKIDALDYEMEIPEWELFFTESEDPNEEQEKQKRDLKFNVGVIMTSSRDFDFTGMGLASGVALPISERLDLNTGLAISYMDKAHLFVPAFHRNNSESATSLAEYYFNGLKSIKQVSLPVSLDYSLTRRLAINSGVNLRYTYVKEVDNNLVLPPSRRPSTRTPNGLVAESPESLFNNANFGLSAGLKYRFSPHVSILLNSEWGMSSIINRNQFQNPSQVQYDLNVINFRTNFTF